MVDRWDLGTCIVTIKLQVINPPEAVKPAFNDVYLAKQKQEQTMNRAEEQYNKIMPEAEGKRQKSLTAASRN